MNLKQINNLSNGFLEKLKHKSKVYPLPLNLEKIKIITNEISRWLTDLRAPPMDSFFNDKEIKKSVANIKMIIFAYEIEMITR